MVELLRRFRWDEIRWGEGGRRGGDGARLISAAVKISGGQDVWSSWVGEIDM